MDGQNSIYNRASAPSEIICDRAENEPIHQALIWLDNTGAKQ